MDVTLRSVRELREQTAGLLSIAYVYLKSIKLATLLSWATTFSNVLSCFIDCTNLGFARCISWVLISDTLSLTPSRMVCQFANDDHRSFHEKTVE